MRGTPVNADAPGERAFGLRLLSGAAPVEKTASLLDGAESGRSQRDLRRATYFAVVSVVYSAALGFASQSTDSSTIAVTDFSHVTIPILAASLSLLSLRLVWLGIATFVLCFLGVELIALASSDAIGWTASGMLKSFASAATIGLIGGTIARSYQMRLKTRGIYQPERVALALGMATICAGVPIAALCVWLQNHGSIPSQELHHQIFLVAQRIFRLGLIASGATLMLRALPDLKEAKELFAHLAAFVVVAVAARLGYHLTTSADPAILATAILFLRPIRVAVVGVMTGIVAYIAITGAYVDLPPIYTADEFRQEILTNIMFFLLVGIGSSRMRSKRIEMNQFRSLGRIARAQELARYGHFIIDPANGYIAFDRLSQMILNAPAMMKPEALLLRTHPEDRDALFEAITHPSVEGVSLPFRFTRENVWSDDGPFLHFNIYTLSEGEDSGAAVYGVLVDTTQLQAQEEHLKQVLQELSDRQGQQTQLFSMISHELRTPASILSMIADELDEGASWKVSGPKMRAVLEQLLSVLSDMRQTVRPEQNLPINIISFAPAELARTVADTFQALAATRGITIRLDIGKEAEIVRKTDRVRIYQTISNLVKNAIVHSQATEVVIAFRALADDGAEWTVADNGRNISREQRAKLFEPFARGDSDGVKSDGSGLGLYIAKQAIGLLGGQLDYVERPMSGAKFRITLPMPIAEDAEEVVTATVPKSDAELDALTTLVIEDSETMGELLVARLSKFFKSVHWVRDGSSGIRWLAEHDADVVITDLYMPGANGDEVARRLRNKGFAGPIVGMTAADITEDVERFKDSGANVVLTKPVRVEDIRRALA